MRAPTHAVLPPLSFMLDEIPFSRRQIARHLDISERTLAKYDAAGSAPRTVMLALFRETKWGRPAADTEAANFGVVNYQMPSRA